LFSEVAVDEEAVVEAARDIALTVALLILGVAFGVWVTARAVAKEAGCEGPFGTAVCDLIARIPGDVRALVLVSALLFAAMFSADAYLNRRGGE
jgi:Na+/proline symporter